MPAPWINEWTSKITGPLHSGGPTVGTDDVLAELLRRTDAPHREARAEFKRLLDRPIKQSDFERLLQRDFRPATRTVTVTGGVPRPRFKGAGSVGDDLLGFALMGAELMLLAAEWEEKNAKELGLTLDEWRRMKDDAWIVGVLVQVAAQAQALADRWVEEQRKRVRYRGRIRVHGFSRK